MATRLRHLRGRNHIACGSGRAIVAARGMGADRVRTLDVEHVFDFADLDLVEWIIPANDGALVDHIIETEVGLNIARDTGMITPNGTLCAYGPALEPASARW